MTNGGGTTQVAQPSALEQLRAQIADHNDQLSNILNNVRGFSQRTMGQEVPSATPGSDSPTAPGILSDMNDHLSKQSGLLDELRSVINSLEKIA